jgi:hypothetical protein
MVQIWGELKCGTDTEKASKNYVCLYLQENYKAVILIIKSWSTFDRRLKAMILTIKNKEWKINVLFKTRVNKEKMRTKNQKE